MPLAVQPITTRSAVQQCLRVPLPEAVFRDVRSTAEVLPLWETWITDLFILVLINIVRRCTFKKAGIEIGRVSLAVFPRYAMSSWTPEGFSANQHLAGL
jgi:hypothetical protein